MRMNGNDKSSLPLRGGYHLHISPNCTLNLPTKQSFDKARGKEGNRTGRVRNIFRKYFLPTSNAIKTIPFQEAFKETGLTATHPPSSQVRGASCICLAQRPCRGQRRVTRPGPGADSLDLKSHPSSCTQCDLLNLSVLFHETVLTSCTEGLV